jgi:hypothetical protein
METNQADTTFKFMKCLLHVCPNPWLHQSSEEIRVGIAFVRLQKAANRGKGAELTREMGILV